MRIELMDSDRRFFLVASCRSVFYTCSHVGPAAHTTDDG